LGERRNPNGPGPLIVRVHPREWAATRDPEALFAISAIVMADATVGAPRHPDQKRVRDFNCVRPDLLDNVTDLIGRRSIILLCGRGGIEATLVLLTVNHLRPL